MAMLIIHVVGLYLIAAAILAAAYVIWDKEVSVTVNVPEFPAATVNVHPAASLPPTVVVQPAAVAPPVIEVHPAVTPAPHIVVTPAPVHQVWQHGGKHHSEQPPETQVEILRDGKHLGWRHSDHPDIQEAISTRGLSVRFPDGTVLGTE